VTAGLDPLGDEHIDPGPDRGEGLGHASGRVDVHRTRLVYPLDVRAGSPQNVETIGTRSSAQTSSLSCWDHSRTRLTTNGRSVSARVWRIRSRIRAGFVQLSDRGHAELPSRDR
jgi:hypothetical protein